MPLSSKMIYLYFKVNYICDAFFSKSYHYYQSEIPTSLGVHRAHRVAPKHSRSFCMWNAFSLREHPKRNSTWFTSSLFWSRDTGSTCGLDNSRIVIQWQKCKKPCHFLFSIKNTTEGQYVKGAWGKPNIETARMAYFRSLVAAKNVDFTGVDVRWVIPGGWGRGRWDNLHHRLEPI